MQGPADVFSSQSSYSLIGSFVHTDILPNSESKQAHRFCANFVFLCTLSPLLQPSSPSSPPFNPYSTFRSQLAQISFPPEASPHFQNRSRCLFSAPLTPWDYYHHTPWKLPLYLFVFPSRPESLKSGVVSGTLSQPQCARHLNICFKLTTHEEPVTEVTSQSHQPEDFLKQFSQLTLHYLN